MTWVDRCVLILLALGFGGLLWPGYELEMVSLAVAAMVCAVLYPILRGRR